MIDVDEIHRLFPHRDDSGRPAYRRYQFEVIRDTLSAFECRDVETVIVEAPTGSGKTDIAKTVALYMTRDYGRAPGVDFVGDEETSSLFQAHMITSMRILQDAYTRSAGRVSLVKGKSNYTCHLDPRDAVSQLDSAGTCFTCADAGAFYGSGGCGSAKCGYLSARDTARRSAVSLFNFDSFLSQVTLGGLFPYPRALVTVDEAHNLEDKVISFASVEVTSADARLLSVAWNPPVSDGDVMRWAAEVKSGIEVVVSKNRSVLFDLRRECLGGRRSPSLVREINRLSRAVDLGDDLSRKLSRYLTSVVSNKPVPWVADFSSDAVLLEPVSGGRFVHSAILGYGRKRMLLSATFLDGAGAFSRSIRIRTRSTRSFLVPSTFPADRRPMVRRYVGDLGHRSYGVNEAAVSSAVSEIVNENQGVRGVIHCTSYALAESLRSSSAAAPGRLVWHGRDDRQDVASRFLSGAFDHDAVLVAVGMTEGFDFVGDLCRFQILIRIPYPYPSKRVKARSEIDPGHMDWRTCLSLVQTYGRGMRSADDRCRTYVLDSRFDRFVRNNRRQLPGWFMEAVI